MSAAPIAPLRKLSIFAVVLATWDAMKLRAANPLAGWQACLEAETQPPIGARLAARQGQPLGSAAAQFGQAGQPGQPPQPASAFTAPAQAPAFGHASSAPKTVPGRPAPMDAAKQGTGSLLHLPQLSTLLNEDLLGADSGSPQDPPEPLLMAPFSLPTALEQGGLPDKAQGKALDQAGGARQ